MMPVVIETERLFLRRPSLDDVEDLLVVYSDPEVVRFIGGESAERADVEDGIRTWLERWADDGFSQLVAVRRDDGRALGCISLNAWDPATWSIGTRAEIGDAAEVELGWKLARDVWGGGYATEGAFAARAWAVREVRLRRLISLIHPENTRSLRVAERLGERYERDVMLEGGSPAQLWTT
jgi:[ribosomal protein S5]-alanine N-acetyltransferase